MRSSVNLIRPIILTLLLGLPAIRTYGAESAVGVESAARSNVEAAQSAKEQTLTQLRRLANAGEAKILGFLNPAEANVAKLTTPLPMFDVPLGAIRAYDVTIHPAKILMDLRQVTYLVEVPERIASIAGVERLPTAKWIPFSFGRKDFAQILVAGVRASGWLPSDERTPFLVRVAPLNALFVGLRNGNEIDFTAVNANIAGMDAGTTMNARDVLRLLKPFARALNGYPT